MQRSVTDTTDRRGSIDELVPQVAQKSLKKTASKLKDEKKSNSRSITPQVNRPKVEMLGAVDVAKCTRRRGTYVPRGSHTHRENFPNNDDLPLEEFERQPQTARQERENAHRLPEEEEHSQQELARLKSPDEGRRIELISVATSGQSLNESRISAALESKTEEKQSQLANDDNSQGEVQKRG